MLTSKKKAAIKGVVKGLKKASKSHATQAKKLKKVLNSSNKKGK